MFCILKGPGAVRPVLLMVSLLPGVVAFGSVAVNDAGAEDSMVREGHSQYRIVLEPSASPSERYAGYGNLLASRRSRNPENRDSVKNVGKGV